MSYQTTSRTQAKWEQLLAGVQAQLPAGSSLSVEGQVMTQAQLVAEATQVIALYTASGSAKVQAHAAVAAVRLAAPGKRVQYAAIVAGLRQLLGSRSPLLAQFGIAPKAVAVKVPTVQQKALAAAKGLATRKARGVLGKRQRAAIPKVTDVSITLAAASSPSNKAAVTPVAQVPATTHPPAARSS